MPNRDAHRYEACIDYHQKPYTHARHCWLTPVILATQQAKIRRITVQNSPGNPVSKKKKKKLTKTGLEEWLKW
jgi:hypothetical protein